MRIFQKDEVPGSNPGKGIQFVYSELVGQTDKNNKPNKQK